MFTGIVERTGVVQTVAGGDEGLDLTLRVTNVPELEPWRAVELGESIAVDGVCLTVVEFENRADGGDVRFQVVPESLSKTHLGDLRHGDRVNLERSLRVGDTLGGHYVTGHVDGVGTVKGRTPEGDQVTFEIEASARMIRQMIPKGSIAVDGVSLTIVDVDRRRDTFTFAAIPHTLERTQLGEKAPGDRVHLETDAFGKWVLHSLASILESGSGPLRSALEALRGDREP